MRGQHVNERYRHFCGAAFWCSVHRHKARLRLQNEVISNAVVFGTEARNFPDDELGLVFPKCFGIKFELDVISLFEIH